ncbi:MAG: hypothetical protein ACR5LC_03360 [Symbiopectobacterium sp.]|uniref:hypothetical protein n=1 Tax=Symbiopectobacterium sp. TaxID=2952789 RepID=UPI003F3F932C
MMIGIGIVVLVLLIIGVGSALQSPSKPAEGATTAASGNGEKSIDLSYSSSKTQGIPVQGDAASGNATVPGQPQKL